MKGVVKKRYKKFLISAIFLVYIILFSLSVEISAATFKIDGTTYDTDVFASDLDTSIYNKNKFFVAYNNGRYYCFFLPLNFTGTVITDLNSGGTRIYTSDSSKWQAYNNWKKENVYSGATNFVRIAYSTFNIYDEDGNVFFLGTPLSLAEVMEAEAKEKRTLGEVLGILPLILVVMVSYLGLRKALSMLFRLLRHA